MKIVKRVIVGNYLPESRQRALAAIRDEVLQAARSVDHPRNSGKLSIRPREHAAHFPNGVTYLTAYYEELMKGAGFLSQYRWPKDAAILPEIQNDPRLRLVFEEDCEDDGPPGPIDFFKQTDGFRVGVEWETGYTGGFHRTMDRIFRAIVENVVDAAIVVVPDRDLQIHCTDRSANFDGISNYIRGWKIRQALLGIGYLEIIVVSYDDLDQHVPYLKKQNKARELNPA